MIAISIKTFNRTKKIIKCINAIQKHCNVDFRLYIYDDSTEYNKSVDNLYSSLKKNGHVVIKKNKRISVTKARNEMMKLLKEEEYMLRIDDDFIFTEKTDLAKMLKIMENRPEIGALADIEKQLGDGKSLKSGEISENQGVINFKNGICNKIKIPVQNWFYFETNEIRFAYANHTRNFLLIRRSVFDDVKWDENLFIAGEHIMFMLDLQRAGWLLAFTPDSLHIHDESDKVSINYIEQRRNKRQNEKDKSMKILYSKYGIKEKKGFHIDKLLAIEGNNNFFRKIKNFIASRS